MGRSSDVNGKRFMREVCLHLSHWIAGTPLNARQEDSVFRVRSTALQPIDGHWKAKGDLVCRPDVPFPFAVECKNVSSVDFSSILDAPKWPVWSWWAQAKSQAIDVQQHPLLIFSRPRREIYTVLQRSIAECLGLPVPALQAPLLDVTRPNGEALTFLVLKDLMQVPAEVVQAIDPPQ